MCCQTTPAIGIEPIKPMTTMRLRFIRKKTPNAQRRTSNIERREFGVGRWNDSRLEFLDDYGRISCDDGIPFYAFGDDCSGCDDRVFTDGNAFQNHSVHSNPDVVADFDWSGLQ